MPPQTLGAFRMSTPDSGAAPWSTGADAPTQVLTQEQLVAAEAQAAGAAAERAVEEVGTGRRFGPAPHVSIILPCFNEQDHVLLELERITAAMDASGYG